MELQFTQQENVFVAEFTAEADFNIHIEKGNGFVTLYQSGVEGGRYDLVRSLNVNNYDVVIDADCMALVYPKYMRIVSTVMPTMAVITFAE